MSAALRWSMAIPSSRFIEVQQHVRKHRPGGGIRLGGSGDLFRVVSVCLQKLSFLLQPVQQPVQFGAVGLAARCTGGTPARLVSVDCSASAITRRANACAASKNAGSFSVVSACNGVLVRMRRTVQSRGSPRRNSACRIRRGSPDKGVKPAAVPVLAFALYPLVVVVRHVPDAFGLRREDAWTADLGAQQAAGRQRGIADHLRFHTEARTARDQAIVGIALQQARARR